MAGVLIRARKLKEIGQKLSQARQAQSLSLEKVSRETYIRLRYLQALEAGDLDVLPSAAQARGFLRAYAGYLGLDPEELLSELDGDSLVVPDHPVETIVPLEAHSEPVADSAEAIFAEIGQTLQHQRELLGFSLDDVEQHTHVRTHYLAALEAGALSNLPSPVQGRGMLSNYTSFLGLDPDPLLLRFAEGLQVQLAAKQAAQARPSRPRRISAPFRLRRFISGDLVFGGLLILGLALFVIWAAIRITAIQIQETVQPTAPSIAQILLPSPSQTATAVELTATGTPLLGGEVAPAESEGTPDFLPTITGGGPIQVNVVIQQRAWMRVTVDGELAFEGRVIPGSAYPFSGEESVEILTGNGAGLRVYYNQQDLGVLGIFGEVINRVFTIDGVATPTATLAPTATASPVVTPTPTNTLEPIVSPPASP